eukprot:jgi/Psemu1/239116/estExt_Genewise1.C_1260036
MVRNIDQVEALIFYGTKSIFYPTTIENKENDKTGTRILLPGVKDLIEECQRDETAVLAILDQNDKDSSAGGKDDGTVVYRTETSPAPNPRDLWEAIHSIQIDPKGFGGSSGFGQKAPDPTRSPSPAHCVVLCETIDKCRAARYAGMRVLCLTENELADAVMNMGVGSDDVGNLDYYWESINMDDIATPGSFWLNPPLSKDDEGNGVDVLSVIESYSIAEEEKKKKKEQQQNESSSNEDVSDPEDDDQYLNAILMDLDPL